MTSEWMKVMLEEIERKLKEAEQARIERERREEECALRKAPPNVRPENDIPHDSSRGANSSVPRRE